MIVVPVVQGLSLRAERGQISVRRGIGIAQVTPIYGKKGDQQCVVWDFRSTYCFTRQPSASDLPEKMRERSCRILGRELLVPAPHGVADGVVMGLLGGAEDVGTNRGWVQATSDRSPSTPHREFPFFANGWVGCSLF